MTVHHGGKVGKAGRTLQTKNNKASTKSKAGKTLKTHQERKH